MPISSLVVKVNPQKSSEVVKSLQPIEHAEVTNIIGDQIVVITDTRDRETDKVIWDSISDIPGVIQVSLVYHNFEDEGES
jgi:nitrate reductase NapD